jgi:hypothetical protein
MTAEAPEKPERVVRNTRFSYAADRSRNARNGLRTRLAPRRSDSHKYLLESVLRHPDRPTAEFPRQEIALATDGP